MTQMPIRSPWAALSVALFASALACSSAEPPKEDAKASDTISTVRDEGMTPDLGASDVGDALCEQWGLYGECDGDVLHFCAFGELKERDCGAEFEALGLEGGCVLLSEIWGHDCALATGQPCVDQAGESAICQGQDSGCFMGADGRYTCFAEVGSCDPDAPLTQRCNGQRLVEFCEVTGQYFGVDCATFGGRCDEALGACVDLPQGQLCDGVERRCVEGLVCQGGTCQAS